MTPTVNDRLLRRTQVEEITGFSVATIYRRVKAGTFPEPIRLGERTVRWLQSDLDAWLAECPRGVGDGVA